MFCNDFIVYDNQFVQLRIRLINCNNQNQRIRIYTNRFCDASETKVKYNFIY